MKHVNPIIAAEKSHTGPTEALGKLLASLHLDTVFTVQQTTTTTTTTHLFFSPHTCTGSPHYHLLLRFFLFWPHKGPGSAETHFRVCNLISFRAIATAENRTPQPNTREFDLQTAPCDVGHGWWCPSRLGSGDWHGGSMIRGSNSLCASQTRSDGVN